jgi:hypothetical protein
MVMRMTFAGTVSGAPVALIEPEHFEATVSVSRRTEVASILLNALVRNENRRFITTLRPQPAHTSSDFGQF